MPEKKKIPGRPGPVTGRVGVTRPPQAAAEALVESAGMAPGPTGEPAGDQPGSGATAAEPAAKSAGTKSAAVRMLTRPVAGKKPAAARGEAQRVADSAKPSQMPQTGRGRRGPRRGASKGR